MKNTIDQLFIETHNREYNAVLMGLHCIYEKLLQGLMLSRDP